MVTIEINGKQVQAEQGQMLIEAADKAGIAIPRFCYHKTLSVSASCRMCLVQVDKFPKAIPACATPVTEGMSVKTNSTMALAAQKAVMEFLLINHPLDCPVCDQGGECDLQDYSIGYGEDKTHYAEIKRVVKDKNIGPLIATEFTRCIHCTRCVRFGQEIAGMREMGATGRGDWMEIGTYIEKSIDSELSGNIIDLCPVGSLTAKPSRFTARVWELVSNDSVGAHDCVGSNTNVQTKNGQIKRTIARANDDINDAWISDRDRYSYEGLQSSERLTRPQIKKDGKWQDASWDEALQFAVDGLKNIDDSQQIGSICSPSATTEEMYLLQKLLRGLGSSNIDHRLRQSDFSGQEKDPLFLNLGMKIADVSAQQAALIIASNVRKEQPIMGHQLRQATLKGAKVSFLNPVRYDQTFTVAHEFIVATSQMFKELKALAKAVIELTDCEVPEGLPALIAMVKVSDDHKQCIKELKDAEKSVVMLGSMAQSMPHYAAMRMLASWIAKTTGSTLSYLTPGANSSGAFLSGLLPHRTADNNSSDGLNTQAMLAEGLKAYILYGIEPDLDIDNPVQANKALSNAEFVVSLSCYETDAIKSYSNVILPIAAMTESSGTLINIDGHCQNFNAVSKAAGHSKPGWKVLRVMGNLFNLSGFDYQSSEEVNNEFKSTLNGGSVNELNTLCEWSCPENSSAQGHDIQRIAELAIYKVDGVTRRSTALQKTQDGQVDFAKINHALAKKLKLDDGQLVTAKQNGHSAEITISIDDRISDNSVYLPAGIDAAASLGGGFDSIELVSASTTK